MFVHGSQSATTRSYSSESPASLQCRLLVLTCCRHISNVPQTRGWEKKISEGPPCVILATPGMLQVGSSRELLELWAPDPRNGIIITGYSVEGTMARVSVGCAVYLSLLVTCRVSAFNKIPFTSPEHVAKVAYLSRLARHGLYSPSFAQDIVNGPEEIISVKGTPIPRRLSVDYISFSAHVDFPQNRDFIDHVKAQHVVSTKTSGPVLMRF